MYHFMKSSETSTIILIYSLTNPMDNNLKKLMYVFFWILPIVIILMFIMKAYSLTNMTEEDSQKVIELIENAPKAHKVTDIDTLHSEICKKVPESPICGDIELLRRIDSIGREKWVPTRLLIGISYSESHIGVNFNKEACRATNNWAWIKWKKHDTWKVIWYTKEKGRADKDGCWLYRFKSVEEWFYSLANTISMWYKTCKNDTKCLSYSYVGNPNVAEQSWIDHVSMWY